MSDTVLNKLENGFFKENKKYLFLLLIIGIASYLIRSFYFESSVPLTFDALGYFFYGVDISILGHLPKNYFLANNLWSIVLSLFFQSIQYEHTIEMMDLQKNVSMFFSIITIIPIYFLCRKFFEPKYSLIGALIFAVEPRIIQNSMLGAIEPLYILLGTLTMVFFLSSNKKFVYVSFLFAALTTIARAEGQMLFFIISIIFFIRFRKEKLVIPKYLIAAGIFVLILTPILIHQSELEVSDSIFGRSSNVITHHTQDPKLTDGESGLPFFIKGIENFPKYFVWDLIPIFIFFVPIGIFYLFKKIDWKKLLLILWGVGISIPAFYIYSIPLQDTRYLFMLYPIFCVLSIFTIKKIDQHFKQKNLVLLFMVIAIFGLSFTFLELKPTENVQKLEISQILKEISNESKVMNSFYPEDHYLESTAIPEKWNDFKNLFLIERIKGQDIRHSIPMLIKTISIDDFSSIEEYVNENHELTHIYIDEKEDRPEFLKDIFNNENKYKFLVKEYDSKDFGYNYHIKIFRIVR